MWIYKITNKLNNKCYIGQTIQNPPEKRWKQHLDNFKNEKFTKPLYIEMRKVGCENFSFNVIDFSKNLEQLNYKEKSSAKGYHFRYFYDIN